MHRLALLALAGTAISGPALGQQPWENAATVEQAIARAVDEAMPSTLYEWSLDWSSFGVRGGRDIFWSLHPPEPYYQTPLPEGVHRRIGRLVVDYASGEVALCGDADIVSMMEIEVSDLGVGKSDVIAELNGRGVSTTLIAEVEHRPALNAFGEPDEADDHYLNLLDRVYSSRTWRLEKEGREPVELTASHMCTPPGTRHATHCWMNWTTVFRPDERVEGTGPCLPPRRPTDD